MAFGKKPILQREGGSIPVVAWFKEKLGVDSILLGFGLPDDRIHAPNEKLDLAYYHNGIRAARRRMICSPSGFNPRVSSAGDFPGQPQSRARMAEGASCLSSQTR